MRSAEPAAEVTVLELPTVSGSKLHLRQLLQNLVVNAIKFAGGAPPKIRVGASESDESWLIYIQDNGIGIASENHDRVFAVFQRVHGAAEYDGSGIGLGTCKKIVESLGGRIWVESELGEGATFHVSLPKGPGARRGTADRAPDKPKVLPRSV